MIGMSFDLTEEQWAQRSIEVLTKLRHHPKVAAYLLKKADECQAIAGDNFETGLQNREGTTRARAWIRPANDEGIREELGDAVLLKAAAAMRGR